MSESCNHHPTFSSNRFIPTECVHGELSYTYSNQTWDTSRVKKGKYVANSLKTKVIRVVRDSEDCDVIIGDEVLSRWIQ